MHAERTHKGRWHIHFGKIMVPVLMLAVTLGQPSMWGVMAGVQSSWIASAAAQPAAVPAVTPQPAASPATPPTANPAAPPTPAGAPQAPSATRIPDCVQPRSTDSLPDGNQKLTVALDPATRWQPGGGMVRFTVAGNGLTASNMQIVGCFRWDTGQANQGWSSPVPLHVLNAEQDKLTLGAIVPEAILKHRPNWWCDQAGLCSTASRAAYDGWGLVPVSDLRILAYSGTGSGWKTLDVSVQVGITLRYMAFLIAVGAIVLAWAVVLHLAKSYPKIRGNGLLRMISNPCGYASLSQLQITTWTFVIAGGAIYVMALSGNLIDIPTQALVLLGISGVAVLGAALPGASASTSAPAAASGTTTPGMVSTPDLVGHANASSVVLTWRPPTAGLPTAGYIVEQSTNAGVAWSQVNGTTEPMLVVNNLTAGTAYQFRVIAVDAQGTRGTASPPLAVSTLAVAVQPPEPPSAPTIGVRGETSITVNWAAPAAEPAGYWLQFRPATSTAWTSVTGPVSATQRTINGLRPDTEYEFRVAAIANGAVSPWLMVPDPGRTTLHVPRWADLIIWDGVNEIDVTRVQMLLFTLIAAGFVLLSIGNESMIPPIPAGILALMGISNGVYLTAKFIPQQR